MDRIISFCKKEFILIISAVLALVSCVFVPVTDYLNYIDTDMISILFCLMVVVAGFAENNFFKRLSQFFIKKCGTTRPLAFTLVLLTMLSSIFITNDVALITFVPFTILTFANNRKHIPYIIVLQTIGANMGSCLSPIGSPQNLYLLSTYNIPAFELIGTMFPVFAISLVIILILCLFVKNEKISVSDIEVIDIKNKRYLWIYFVLFLLCILTVAGVIDSIIVLSSVVLVVAIAQPKLFVKIDIGLLLTFVFFFIFVGNMQNIQIVRTTITEFVDGREFLSSVVLSQVISNVPTAIMVSGFSDNAKAILLGTNIGGLGTVIASLASVISFKYYSRIKDAKPFRYLCLFSVINFSILILLYFTSKVFLL